MADDDDNVQEQLTVGDLRDKLAGFGSRPVVCVCVPDFSYVPIVGVEFDGPSPRGRALGEVGTVLLRLDLRSDLMQSLSREEATSVETHGRRSSREQVTTRVVGRIHVTEDTYVEVRTLYRNKNVINLLGVQSGQHGPQGFEINMSREAAEVLAALLKVALQEGGDES